MKVRFVTAAALAAAILLGGCATTPRSKDTALAARIAYLESTLAASEQQQKQQASTDAQRLAAIEGQLGRIATLLEQKAAPASASAPAPAATPVPEAPKDTTAPPAAPGEGPLVKRSEDFEFQGASSSSAKFVASLEKRFDSSSKLKPKHFRNEMIGKPLPQSRFIGPDGSIVDLNDLRGEKRLVLVFLRGFTGFVCPACSAQTIALMKHAEDFAQRDAQIVLIYPGAAESVAAFVDSVKAYENDSPLPFPILLDVNLGAVQAFGIEGALAKPTSIIVDREGLVQFAYVGESYADRPSATTLLQAIDEMSK